MGLQLSNAYLHSEPQEKLVKLAHWTIRFCRRTKEIVNWEGREPSPTQQVSIEFDKRIIERGFPPGLGTRGRKKKKGRGRKKGSTEGQTEEAASDQAPNPTGEHQMDELQEGMAPETAHRDADSENADHEETVVETLVSDEESDLDPALETPAEARDYRELLDLG